VLSDDNAGLLDESVAGLHEVSQVFARNSEALERLIQDLSAAGDRMPGTIDSMERTAGSLERMGNSLADAGDQLTMTMRDTQSEVRHISQQLTPDAVAVLAELRMVSASLERFVADLERDPSLLIYGRRSTDRGPGE
jgi:phospholipid/cholesterol/gamma-HCH transport system substrate-binding protein